MKNLRSIFNVFRLIALLEGISFILLVGIAMPLKHIYGYKDATMDVGMAHGVLFIGYCVLLIPVKEKMNWSLKQVFMAFLASLLPFGTFVAEYRWFRKETELAS